MDRDELVHLAGEKADENRHRGFHCSESVLRALAEVLQVEVGDDLERASTVFRGGGGGYGDRCGAVTGGAMVVSLLMGDAQSPEAARCRELLVGEIHKRFTEKMGSNLCGVVRPLAQTQWSSDQSCGITYRVGAETAMEVLFDHKSLCDEAAEFVEPVLNRIQG